MINNNNSRKFYITDAILFIVFGMVIGWWLILWKQNTIVNGLIWKHDSKYIKFSAIDQLLEDEFYDEDTLRNSANDMLEWALAGYVWAIDDPHTVYLREEDNTELTNELQNEAGFAGIWAVIEKQENYVVISEVLKNSATLSAFWQ